MITKEKEKGTAANSPSKTNHYQNQSGGFSNQFSDYDNAKPAQRQQKPDFRKDNLTNHKIYDAVLNCLSSPQIHHRGSGQPVRLSFQNALPSADAERVERELIHFAENYSTRYEVRRRVPRELLEQLKREGNADAIFNLRIAPLPNWLLNCFICQFLLERFSRRELLACPGFVEVETSDERGVLLRRVQLDISEYICRRGFLRPVLNGNLIVALKIYRHVADDRPFNLRSRFGGFR